MVMCLPLRLMKVDMETTFEWRSTLGQEKSLIGNIKFNDVLEDASEKVPKTIYISAQCCDRFSMSVMDADWQEIANYDGYVPSFMPNRGGYGDYVQMEITIETGVILDWENPIGDSEFDDILRDGRRVPRTISICAPCSDRFDMSVIDTNGKCIANYDGYVPSFIPNSYGDYVDMNIDIETGRILNWRNPIRDRKFIAIARGIDEEYDEHQSDDDQISKKILYNSNGFCRRLIVRKRV